MEENKEIEKLMEEVVEKKTEIKPEEKTENKQETKTEGKKEPTKKELKAQAKAEKLRQKEEHKKQKEAMMEARETKWIKLKRFGKECRRVLKVTKKPDKQEFITIVKVSALGMAIIGVIGFLISLIKELLL